MAITKPVPITSIQYWRTGLYTNRQALFAPFRTIGLQVMRSNDALIDGADMDITDRGELKRRNGFSRYCSQQLAAGEVVNQFYSFRTPSGTVLPLFDSNQRLALFNTTTITTLWGPTTLPTKGNAAQSFPLLVEDQIYVGANFANGQKRINTNDNSLHGLGIAAPAAMPTVAAPTTANATFWQPNLNFGTNAVFLLDPNGNIQQPGVGSLTTGAQPPVWNTTLGAFTNEALGHWVNVGPPGSWAASTVYTIINVGAGGCILDSNGNIQQLNNSGGTSGATQPVWSTTIGGLTTDNTVQWICRSNRGPLAVFSGYQHCYVYSTQAPTVTTGYYHCSTASPFTYNTGPVFGPWSYNISGAFSTNTDVTSVDIYRIKDSGSVFEYAGSVANNTAGGIWTFLDNIADINLNTELVVPLGLDHINDPPPGQTGAVDTTDFASYLCYWNGRLWAIAGGGVNFTAGPDCTNGDPNAAWPPGNRFTFPGQPIAIIPTSMGILVFTADSVKFIAGGPQTASFYSGDLWDKMGISSPNAISKDGDTLNILSTNGQLYSLGLSSGSREDAGYFIADLIQTVPEANAYLTTHRNGLDAGLFLGDGSTGIYRYGLNSQAWSTKYNPVGGIKALRSIETSVGNYSLMAARASTAGFLLARDLTTYQDDGSSYPCFATIGSIVLTEIGQQPMELHYVLAWLDATGIAGGTPSLPTVSIMPNETNPATSATGFILLPGPQDEAALWQNTPSTSLIGKQWSVRNIQTRKISQIMHHLQIKLAFPAENQPSLVNTLVLKHDET